MQIILVVLDLIQTLQLTLLIWVMVSFSAYGLESVAKISNFGYNKSTDSISFSADHYNPLGGIVTFKIPQLDNNHDVTIFLDNLGLKDQQITKNGKTIITNIFVPPNEHVIRIAGILNQ